MISVLKFCMLYNVPVTTISESYPHAISQSANLEALSVPSHSQLNQHLLPLSYWVIIGIESKRDYKYLKLDLRYNYVKLQVLTRSYR